jgi:hypothetical protein
MKIQSLPDREKLQLCYKDKLLNAAGKKGDIAL